MRATVWAPDAGAVDLVLPATGRRVPLEKGDDGWWSPPAGEAELEHGDDYAFAVDGSDPRPDPRSAWQPDGVHGPSRMFDTGRHAWSDGAWQGRDVRDCVVYELHVGTFTPGGTLDSAVERLDHLVDLGVGMVELMPVAAFDGQHGWGYDGVDLYAVHEAYGGPAALQRFVDEAHARGLAVCLDVVHNHLGPSGNYLDTFGPYFTEAHETPWGRAVNLDGPGADEVRRWVCDNALRWLRDFHLDALRLDAVHALVDDSPRHILAQLADEVAALSREVGRPLSLIAESDLNDAAMVTPTADGGRGMTAQWADDVHHAVHTFLTGERQGYYADFGSPEVLAKTLTRVFLHDGEYSAFRGKVWGAPVPAGTDARRFVVFDQDHDQVGNRALGDRPSTRLDEGTLAVSAALILTSPFTPMLFMGQEWGSRTPFLYFTDHQDPELADAVRNGRREEFSGHGWAEMYPDEAVDGEIVVPDPQDPATVESSTLVWDDLSERSHARMLAWYRWLIALRAGVPDLTSGDLAATSVDWDRSADPDGASGFASWLVVTRGGVRVVANLGEQPASVPVAGAADMGVLAEWEPVETDADTVRVPARSVAVLASGLHSGAV
jgi:maltooligosyltrehalose trehalohydrolase